MLLSLFLLFLGEIFQQLNLERCRQKLLLGHKKENSQIFNEDSLTALPSSMAYFDHCYEEQDPDPLFSEKSHPDHSFPNLFTGSFALQFAR
jgi:hypothetical protein